MQFVFDIPYSITIACSPRGMFVVWMVYIAYVYVYTYRFGIFPLLTSHLGSCPHCFPMPVTAVSPLISPPP